jgi:quercetin dioxygenase-like cupin family protein
VSLFKVDFNSMDWQDGRPGVRYKSYCEGARQIRLVEFETSEGFSDWCEIGHIGMVLSGGLTIDFNGQVITFAQGDGIFIPAGPASSHRAVAITPGTRLLMVENAD